MAEAQKRTDTHLVKLDMSIDKLAEAQKRTEERVGELAEAQKQTDTHLVKLDMSIDKLAEAQKRTEERVEELAEAQKRTEERVEELAEAQKQTDTHLVKLDMSIDKLAEAQKQTNLSVTRLSQAVGALSDTIGYGLEDVAKVVVPSVLEKYKSIKIDELERKFVSVAGKEYEIDLYGTGFKGHEKLTIIGECKSRIYGRDVKEFIEILKDIESTLPQDLFKFMFGFFIHPSAQRLAESFGIFLIVSYMK
ncbi:MAG: hypothetical protein ACTSQI_18485 [Candidatus Helarchaeota archaeon]